MYSIIYIISQYTRGFILPNPFQTIIENEIIALLFNTLIGEVMIVAISYSMCGIFYKRGNGCAWAGSLGFLFFFIVNVGLIRIISNFVQDIGVFYKIYSGAIIVIFLILIFIKKKIVDIVY